MTPGNHIRSFGPLLFCHCSLVNFKHRADCLGVGARNDDAPDVYERRVVNALIREVIADGIKGEIPAYREKLRESDIGALIIYLRTVRSSVKLTNAFL